MKRRNEIALLNNQDHIAKLIEKQKKEAVRLIRRKRCTELTSQGLR